MHSFDTLQSGFTYIRDATARRGQALVFFSVLDDIRILERTSKLKIPSATTKNKTESDTLQYSGTVTCMTAGKAAKGRLLARAVIGATSNAVKIVDWNLRTFRLRAEITFRTQCTL